MANSKGQTTTHYTLLGLKPTASVQQIRQAYRDRSKLYHPDTTELPDAIATAKFQSLNEAYATLSSPERRLAYDHSIGYSRIAVVQAPAHLNRPASERSRYEGTNAYLDPTDRPLSAGELFALFILGVTFVCCLMLVVAVSFTRGNLIQATAPTPPPETSTMPAPAPDVPDPAPSLPTPKDSVPPDPLPTLTL